MHILHNAVYNSKFLVKKLSNSNEENTQTEKVWCNTLLMKYAWPPFVACIQTECVSNTTATYILLMSRWLNGKAYAIHKHESLYAILSATQSQLTGKKLISLGFPKHTVELQVYSTKDELWV